MEPTDPLTGGFAVRQVLEAEREADERIGNARLAAEQSLEKARTAARAIEQRAVEATRKIQQTARQFSERRIARLERETRHLLEQTQHEHPEVIIDALAKELALQLIGFEPSVDPDASAPGERSP